VRVRAQRPTKRLRLFVGVSTLSLFTAWKNFLSPSISARPSGDPARRRRGPGLGVLSDHRVSRHYDIGSARGPRSAVRITIPGYQEEQA
jgi:hypothetical protein